MGVCESTSTRDEALSLDEDVPSRQHTTPAAGEAASSTEPAASSSQDTPSASQTPDRCAADELQQSGRQLHWEQPTPTSLFIARSSHATLLVINSAVHCVQRSVCALLICPPCVLSMLS